MHLMDLFTTSFNVRAQQRNAESVLPRTTKSLCPECREVIDATIYQDGDWVFMRKRCTRHGLYRELLSTDASFYKLMIRRDRSTARGVTHPVAKGSAPCPNGCGICNAHQSTPMMMNIDLTNRCNLNCPVCFANAGARGEALELDLDQVRYLLDKACEIHEVQPPCLQYTGGEPTVHPKFIQALQEAKTRGFTQVQIATNGVAFARNPQLAVHASEAGLNAAYLQFDGLSDQVYQETRGQHLLALKLDAINHLYQANIRTILVPTIVKGVNDDQIGPILDFAVKYTDRIAGISWQPVAFTGRLNYQQRLKQRFTIADLAREVEKQTQTAQMYRDWYPFDFIDPFVRFLEGVQKKPSAKMNCHPSCGAGTYLIVDSTTHKAWPVPSFVDVDGLMEVLALGADRLIKPGLFKKLGLVQKLRHLEKFYDSDAAPTGWSFEQFVDFMIDFADFRNRYKDNISRVTKNCERRYRPLLMASMHFQDVYNYQLDRLQRCVVHYAAADGRIYPFCSYNSGPCHRNRVEQQFALSLQQCRASEPI